MHALKAKLALHTQERDRLSNPTARARTQVWFLGLTQDVHLFITRFLLNHEVARYATACMCLSTLLMPGVRLRFAVTTPCSMHTHVLSRCLSVLEGVPAVVAQPNASGGCPEGAREATQMETTAGVPRALHHVSLCGRRALVLPGEISGPRHQRALANYGTRGPLFEQKNRESQPVHHPLLSQATQWQPARTVQRHCPTQLSAYLAQHNVLPPAREQRSASPITLLKNQMKSETQCHTCSDDLLSPC